MKSKKTGSEFGKGVSAGFNLFGIELLVFALLLAGAAMTSNAVMALLTFLVSLVSFLLSVVVGAGRTEEFLTGFLIGGFLALGIAWQLSDPMFMPVIFGIIATIVGTFIGLYLRRPKQ